jgi:hypothetical protein
LELSQGLVFLLQPRPRRGTINPAVAADGRGASGCDGAPGSFTQADEGKRIMSRRFLFLLVAAGIGTGWAMAGEPAGTKKLTAVEKAAADRAARLVADLGSDDYETRERAARQLEALGSAVGPALHKAITSTDPEVRRLALEVAGKIARKLETAEVLEPKRFRVAYRDTPLNVALEDFKRVSGANIQLENVKATDRKITLDTGYTSFWDAFDKFCAAAGVTEKLFDSPVNDNGQNAYYPGMGFRRRIVYGRGGQQPADFLPALPNGQFTLIEAKSAPVRPTFQSGALRFRALPPGTSMGRASSLKGDSEVVFGLEVIPEPALNWEKVQSLRIDRAVDEHGQVLTANQAYANHDPVPNEYDEVMIWGDYYGGNQQKNNFGQRVPLRLMIGRKPSTVLKELSGVATIKMQTSTQTIATVDNILKAGGKGAQGTDGSHLKIVEVKREEGGKIDIQVQVEQAPQENAWNPWGFRRFWWGGGYQQDGEENADNTVSTGHLVLFDERGNLIRLVRKEPVPDENGVLEEYHFVFQVARGAPEPAKLVLQGRKPVTIDVPFTLKDVPLRAAPGAPRPAPPPKPNGPIYPQSEIDILP